MSKKFEEMKEFLDVYFCMDYDLFGENVDEIVKCYVYDAEENDIFRLSNELHTYLNDNSDDKNDILFNSIFDIHYCYKNYYINSGEFLRNVLGKLIFYRDQRLQEEVDAKKT